MRYAFDLVCFAIFAALVVTIAILVSSCGAACQTERAVVDALGVGINAADSLVGERGGDNYETASLIAHGSHDIGVVLAKSCEALRDGKGWEHWLMLALEAATAVVEIIDGAGPEDIGKPPPIELVRAIAMMEALLDGAPFN